MTFFRPLYERPLTVLLLTLLLSAAFGLTRPRARKGSDPVRSRSVLRREAIQQGEEMPTFVEPPVEPAGERVERSQVQSFGGPSPKTWDDYEAGCHATYGGGYRTEVEREIFRHGMSTVFNLLRREFLPAAQARKLDALKAAFAVEKAAAAYCQNGDRVQIVGVPVESLCVVVGDGSPLPPGLWMTEDSTVPFVVKESRESWKTRIGKRYMKVAMPTFPPA